IFHPQQFDKIALKIVNAVPCAPVTVAWLAYATDIDEILSARLDASVFFPFLPDAGLAPNKDHRHMGVAKKTDSSPLISETCRRVERVKNVAPLSRRIECGVHDRKIVYPLL